MQGVPQHAACQEKACEGSCCVRAHEFLVPLQFCVPHTHTYTNSSSPLSSVSHTHKFLVPPQFCVPPSRLRSAGARSGPVLQVPWGGGGFQLAQCGANRAPLEQDTWVDLVFHFPALNLVRITLFQRQHTRPRTAFHL